MTTPLRRFSLLLAGSLAVPALLTAGAGTASAAGGAPMRDLCLPVPGLPCVPLPGGPTATTPASISGSPKVDLVLTANDPTWSDPSTVTTYQWQRDGASISGATKKTYTVQLDDIGANITVAATGTVNLLNSTTSVSDPVIGVTGEAPTATRPPTIAGTGRPGDKLTAAPGTWSGSPTPTFSYQWYRVSGGSTGIITGAADQTYVPKTGDAGSKLAVVVSAERPGHETGMAAAAVTIIKRTSTTKLTSRSQQVSGARPAVVQITIASAGGTPTGRVQLLDDEKKIDTVKVGTRAHGTVKVTLPRLSAGTHVLRARFVGTGTIAASTSKKLVLTVR